MPRTELRTRSTNIKAFIVLFRDQKWRNYRKGYVIVFWKRKRPCFNNLWTGLRRRRNYWNSDCPYTFLKAKQYNNYYETLKMTKLPKFWLSIYIFESQTEQQLLGDFKDDEITDIRTVHKHFWKPNRTTTTTRLWRWRNYRNLDQPYTFLKAKQNNNYYFFIFTLWMYLNTLNLLSNTTSNYGQLSCPFFSYQKWGNYHRGKCGSFEDGRWN